MVEYPVDPLSAPYLVTSTRSVMWVDHASREGYIRAAVRKVPNIAALSLEMLQAIKQMGTECHWGNCAGFTSQGICQVVDHVRSYGLDNLEILVHVASVSELPENLPAQIAPVKWLPLKTAVVLPVDRNYVGFASFVGSDDHMIAIIHNASRGVGIATDLMLL